MTRRARVLLVLAPLLGCFPEEAPPIPAPGAGQTAVGTAPAQPTTPAARPKRPREQGASLSAASDPAATGDTAATNPALADTRSTPEPPPRNLSDELRGLISNPSACFSKRTAGGGPPTLTLSISAAVTPSGMVNRATVSGATLTDEETACLEAMVVQARFKSPVEDAPTTVQTTVELREQAPAKKAP